MTMSIKMAGLVLFQFFVGPACGMSENTTMIIIRDCIKTRYFQCNPFKEIDLFLKRKRDLEIKVFLVLP